MEWWLFFADFFYSGLAGDISKYSIARLWLVHTSQSVNLKEQLNLQPMTEHDCVIGF